MNQYPLWKYGIIGVVLFFCTLYALPNIFGNQPAVQISPEYASEHKVDENLKKTVDDLLKEKKIEYLGAELDPKRLLLRFPDTDMQRDAYSALQKKIPGYVVAQNLVPAAPSWLRMLGGEPMYLGLDLRGGVHFLMQVDMAESLKNDEEQLIGELRSMLRKNKLHHKGIRRLLGETGGIQIMFNNTEVREKATQLLRKQFGTTELTITPHDENNQFGFHVAYTDAALQENRRLALEQNITTLRNRVNELGVAEPVIQRQGEDRIVVQLPGVQDTARAKEILGATATLEFRLTHGNQTDWLEAQRNGRAPLNARLYKERNGASVLLQRSVIVTGDQVVSAASGIDQQTKGPAVIVNLDSKGAARMFDTTRNNVGHLMAVVFIEYRDEKVEGQTEPKRRKVEEVINTATIREPFGKRFQVTGLTQAEANNLALLLRAGALKAPMQIVEERTIGPSLGAENVRMGMISIAVGFLAVMFFMWWRYSQFGLIANIALLLNLVILVALMSLIQATLTLPGIAGIVLTLGMAVDANVLIFERIREELANGSTPQASIHAGFEKAFSTIADSNITTLIAAIMLYAFGTGPIKGFAITLSFGIVSSMFTAIFVSRGIINYFYGNRRIERLPV